MISLPTDKDQTWPLIRILVMPQGKWTDPKQPWEILDCPKRIADPNSKTVGYELDFCERVALPEYGRAEFHFTYGSIDGKTYTARDLTGYHVRIQAADETEGSKTPQWQTIYLGTVDSQMDSPWPSDFAAGDRRYCCVDILYRTSRWPLNRHTLYQNGTLYTHAFGHPGYNYAVAGYFRRLMGNCESTGVTVDPFGDLPSTVPGYRAHAWTGSDEAKLWTDQRVIEHALISSRAKGEPVFTLKNAGAWSADAYPWPVGEGEKCWSLLCRVLSRQRGRGIAFLDWDDDSKDPAATISPFINTAPQNYADVSYTKPSGGGPITIVGGSSASISVDITGDHRFVDGSLATSVNDSTGVDYLETYGEPIECLVTLSGIDSTLEKRWTDADATTFLGITQFWKRQSTRWRSVFQRWSIPVSWDFTAGDGNGAGKTTCHFLCNDSGAIIARNAGDTNQPTSPLLLKIGCDIPIYEGFNYVSASPVRYDGASDYMAPPRNPPLILVRTAANQYVNGSEDLGLGMQVDDFGVFVMSGDDQAAGTRLFSGAGSVVGGGYDKNDLVISVGLTFGHRVRMASANTNPATSSPYTAITAGRKLSVYLQGAHLWLAHPLAIWEHDKFNATNYAAPAKRAAAAGAGAVPGIIRDDRDALALTHALAWSWYGTRRTSAQWALNACGLLADFEVDGGDRVKFPKIGQLVKEIKASGGSLAIKTPISRVHYSHTEGRATWFTDWQDLDTAAL